MAELFFPLKAILPLLPLFPQTVWGYSSGLASFPNRPWCRRGAGSAVPALHIIATAQDGYTTAFVGAAGALCPDPSPSQKTGDGGKHLVLPQKCCSDISSGLTPCLVEACSSETPPKSQVLMKDNGAALEPTEFQALNRSF